MGEVAGGIPADVRAKLDAMPTAATVAPPATSATAPVLGSDVSQYARADHTHPSRVQSGTVTLNASGEATWTYGAAFPDEPNMRQPVYFETADNLPIVFKIKDYVREKTAGGAPTATLQSAGGTGNYVGVVIKGSRLSNATTPGTVTVLGLSVLNAVTLNIASGGSLTGIKVYLQVGPSA